MTFKKGLPRTLDNYEKWWAGELDRPLISVSLIGHEPSRKPPKHIFEGQKSFGNPEISPEDIIDGADYELSRMEFLGDSYPLFDGVCSGPGIVAAFLGADVSVDKGNIWFFPKKELPIEELHFQYQEDNFWLQRTKAIMAEGKRRWGDSVVIGMPDLGGVMDILATFRGTGNLMLDLYDSPDEVIRAANEIKVLWHRYYDELLPYTVKNFTTDWSTILSKKRSYMTQSDFCYMLGKDMFKQFILDELTDTCDFLDRGCYHLDGVGQIQFLDYILEIKGMDLIQWVPGDGPYAAKDWFDLYRKVLEAGKHLEIMYDSDFKALDKVIDHFGTGKNIFRGFYSPLPLSDRDYVMGLLERYGVE